MKCPLRFVPFLLLAIVSGCGSKDKPVYANVKGKVTYNDSPIEKGKIIFALEGRPPSAIDIVDGKFSGQAMVGSNKVSISAKKRVANPPALPKNAQIQAKGYMEKFKRAPNQGAGTTSEYDASLVEYIPPEWGSKSTQTYVVQTGTNSDIEFNVKGPKH
jgi:hypothetical protein